MFMETHHYLIRDHNEHILREVRANRMEKRMRTGGDPRRTIGALVPGAGIRVFGKEAEPEKV